MLKGAITHFLAKIAIADGEISNEELQFFSALLDINTREAIVIFSDDKLDCAPLLNIITTLGNAGITNRLPNGTDHPMILLFNLFTKIGELYVNTFPKPAHIWRYNTEMQHICQEANKDTSLPHRLAFPLYNPTGAPIPQIQTPQATTPAATSKQTKVNQIEPKQNISTLNPMEELNNLIGLSSIKKDVSELIGLVKIMKMREDKGMKTVPTSLHLVFTGNPGTGKTTVARILASLYKEIGVLKTGQLIEVDRSELVAGYVGQTAIKTQQKINEALGGILFIDEAYTLAKEGNDFGQEAIDTLLKEMEDKRGQFVVIVAGYDEPMKRFIDSNPGLKSRFNKFFHFPDYSEEELIQIFNTMCKKYDYIVEPKAQIAIENVISDMVYNKGDNFANARNIRNLFERIITKQANRIATQGSATEQDIITITIADIT